MLGARDPEVCGSGVERKSSGEAESGRGIHFHGGTIACTACRSSNFSGNDDVAAAGEEDVTTVYSPKAGVSLTNLGDFEEAFEDAVRRARPEVRGGIMDLPLAAFSFSVTSCSVLTPSADGQAARCCVGRPVVVAVWRVTVERALCHWGWAVGCAQSHSHWQHNTGRAVCKTFLHRQKYQYQQRYQRSHISSLL